jgi:DNA-binding MarR family transcriptional regulator
MASSTTPSALDLDRQICHALYSASNALVRAYRPILQPLDLTYPQYVVMMSLWQRDQVSITELSQHTRFDAGTLTPMLKRLQVKGLLDSTPSKIDERQKVVTLTQSGRALRKRASKVPGDLACTVDMPQQQGLQLKALCETLISSLDDQPHS